MQKSFFEESKNFGFEINFEVKFETIFIISFLIVDGQKENNKQICCSETHDLNSRPKTVPRS